jgi:hypothetical protein
MRQTLNVWLVTAAMFAIGATAHAQTVPTAGPYTPDAVNALVDKVQTDLNQGYSHWRLANGDHERLNKAEKRLRGFAADWRRGKFDKGDLDDSISAIQHVLDNNHLSGTERDALWSDTEQLRRMREAYDRHDMGGSN